MEENRYALIIACNHYNDKDLRKLESPVYDAEVLSGVLKNPAIGNFNICDPLINKPSHEIKVAIEGFFANRRHEDLLLLYFSGHGIKDEDGQLYFAAADTRRSHLRSTAIEASFIKDIMERSRSRTQVVVLDCCHSGAFVRSKGDTHAGAIERLKGKGRFVITASDAMQYAFEGDPIEGKATPSIFTNILVEGLQTGKADRDGDGHVTIDELYQYIYEQMDTLKTPHQKPEKSEFSTQGKIVIARNPHPIETPLPKEIVEAIQSKLVSVREASIDELRVWLQSGNRGKELTARKTLELLAIDDSRRVSEKAKKLLGLPQKYNTTEVGSEEQSNPPQQEPPGNQSVEMPQVITTPEIKKDEKKNPAPVEVPQGYGTHPRRIF
ncbi:MAG: hypothetical protein FJ264_15210 [Planctomycetes bacterium]|nr:hypothetical protein [Planctomycetota bacterium]